MLLALSTKYSPEIYTCIVDATEVKSYNSVLTGRTTIQRMKPITE